MTEKILSLIRPEIKTSVGGRITYYNVDVLEAALREDPRFSERCSNCKFDWPGEIVQFRDLAHWLLAEAERSGSAELAWTKINDFLDAPRRTWQSAVVCTDALAQNKGVAEGWEFCNGVTAYAAGLSEDYTILSDDRLIGKGLILLDNREEAEISDFIIRVTDCCRALSFVAGEGCWLRPTYSTYVYETSAPHPVGSIKGWLSDRRNRMLPLITGEMFDEADSFLQNMQSVAECDLPALRRVLDRHAGAVVWGDIENRAIEARICMEMILMNGSKGDNVFKVSRRAAYLMSDDLAQRRERMQQAKDLYDAGSSVVHEGRLKNAKQINAVRDCHNFLDEPVRAWLRRNSRCMSDSDWAEVELGGNFPAS